MQTPYLEGWRRTNSTSPGTGRAFACQGIGEQDGGASSASQTVTLPRYSRCPPHDIFADTTATYAFLRLSLKTRSQEKYINICLVFINFHLGMCWDNPTAVLSIRWRWQSCRRRCKISRSTSTPPSPQGGVRIRGAGDLVRRRTRPGLHSLSTKENPKD